MVTYTYMNETQTMKGAVVKTLAIVGFLVTIIGLAYLAMMGVQRAPGGFASLSSIAESINLYRPTKELSIATEKIVVNSSDSFQISWTDLKASGEYKFTYACVSGVRLEVRSADGTFVPMKCTDELTLPATAHGLFLTALSDDNRFTDIPLTVSFTNSDTKQKLSHTTKVTVVNVLIPVDGISSTIDIPSTPSDEAVEEKKPETPVSEPASESTQPPVVVPVETTKPVVENTYSDLGVIVLGGGVLQNGAFAYTKTFGTDLNNAIRFEVKNVGTKTSGTWSFTTILPSGEVYTSPVQAPLAPQARVVFTLGFYLNVPAGEVVKFTNSLSITGDDAKTTNNTASLSVVVE